MGGVEPLVETGKQHTRETKIQHCYYINQRFLCTALYYAAEKKLAQAVEPMWCTQWSQSGSNEGIYSTLSESIWLPSGIYRGLSDTDSPELQTV